MILDIGMIRTILIQKHMREEDEYDDEDDDD